MKPRERVLRAIEFETPDRVPNGCYYMPGALERHGKALKRLFHLYPRDFFSFLYDVSDDWGQGYRKGIFRDEWGCVWRNLQRGICGQVIEHPLTNWRSLDDYEFPDPLKGFDKVEEIIRSSGHVKYIVGGAVNFFERLQYLRGFENLMVDLILKRGELKTLINRLLNYNLEHIKRWLEFDIDGVLLGDDWGTQTGLMVSPQIWREQFKPLYREMCKVVHNSGKHVFFHSDGYILEILPDLIEVGVDALNLQIEIMGINVLSERIGGKICVLSDIDRQHVLPYGSVEDMVQYVKDVINAFGSFDGGLISWGEVGFDVPLANAEAMLKAFMKYGWYPLKRI